MSSHRELVGYAYVKVFIWYYSHKRKLMTGEVVSYEK